MSERGGRWRLREVTTNGQTVERVSAASFYRREGLEKVLRVPEERWFVGGPGRKGEH